MRQGSMLRAWALLSETITFATPTPWSSTRARTQATIALSRTRRLSSFAQETCRAKCFCARLSYTNRGKVSYMPEASPGCFTACRVQSYRPIIILPSLWHQCLCCGLEHSVVLLRLRVVWRGLQHQGRSRSHAQCESSPRTKHGVLRWGLILPRRPYMCTVCQWYVGVLPTP